MAKTSPQATTQVSLRYLRIAPRKTRLVADVIRGMSVNNAEAQLMISPRRPSVALLKLLRSGVANAKLNLQADPDALFIKEIRVDGGPMMKRWTPRARGSAAQIQKKMSHITITLGVSTTPTKSRFTILAKPKKEKKDTEKKKGKKVKSTESNAIENKEEEGVKKEIQEKPRSQRHNAPRQEHRETPKRKGKGFMSKIFQRKSI